MHLPKQAIPIQRTITATALANRGVAPAQVGQLAGVACNLCEAIFPPGRNRADCLRTCGDITRIGGGLIDTVLNFIPFL